MLSGNVRVSCTQVGMSIFTLSGQRLYYTYDSYLRESRLAENEVSFSQAMCRSRVSLQTHTK
jgi:hypothetical protein